MTDQTPPAGALRALNLVAGARADASTGQESRTFVPQRSAAEPQPTPRQVSGIVREDLLEVVGALVVAFCAGTILFGWLSAYSGLVGFIVLVYALFLVAYAAMVSLSHDGPALRDRLATVGLYSIASVALLALGSVVFMTVWNGRHPLVHLNFFTKDLSTTSYKSGFTHGGITHALVGTLWEVGIALVITVPLGIAGAVYLSEVGGRMSRVVGTIVQGMTALPSIVAGLFIYILWIVTFHQEHSGFAASLALGVTMLPIIIRSAEVVLRLVPGNLREASAALGSPLWRTAWNVVLPTARSGLITSVILGTAWGVGETAPVLLTAGYTTYLNGNPSHGPMASLPLITYELARTGLKPMIERAYAAGAVLLLLVVVLFAIARLLGGRGAGHVSATKARRIRRQSARDLSRFEGRLSSNGAMP